MERATKKQIRDGFIASSALLVAGAFVFLVILKFSGQI